MPQHDVVALQLQGALHLGVDDVRQRQVQAERQFRIAAGRGFVGEMADPFQHRAGSDVLEEVLHRAGGSAVDVEHAVMGAQVGNHRLHIGQRNAQGACSLRLDLHARTVEHDAAADLFRQRPHRRLAILGEVAGFVIEASVHDASSHAEFSLGLVRRAILEREMRQVAAQAQRGLAQHAVFQRTCQPAAGMFRRLLRQVAADAVDGEIIDAAAEVGHARALGALAARQRVAAGQLQLHAVLYQVQLFQLDCQLPGVRQRPAAIQPELLERHRFVIEPGRHRQREARRIEGHAAALLSGFHMAAQFFEAGDVRQRRHRQRLGRTRDGRARRQRFHAQRIEIGRQLVVTGCRQRAAPAGHQVAHAAARRSFRQQVALHLRQRQAGCQFGQDLQVQRGSFHLGPGRLVGRRHLARRGGGRRQFDAVARAQRHILQFQRARDGRWRAGRGHQGGGMFFARRHAAAQGSDVQLRQVLAQCGDDVVQRHIGGDGGRARIVDAEPGAHATAGGLDVQLARQVRLPARQVGTAQFRIQLALPVLDVGNAGKRLVAEIGAHVERRRHRSRRRRLEGKLVAPPLVQHQGGDVFKLQRRTAALHIGPHDAAIAHHHFALRQQPVGALAIALLFQVDVDAGGVQLAIGFAPHVDFRAVEFQRFKAQAAGRHAPPR